MDLPKPTFVMLLKRADTLVNMALVKTSIFFWALIMEANPTEILYNEIGEDMVNVFHAMPCRSRFLYQFEEGGIKL